MTRATLITILLLTCPVLADTPPPPAAPPIPSNVAVTAGGADEDEPLDVEPLPRIDGPAAAIAGTIVKMTAHGSRNGRNYAWLVMPPLPCEVSVDGKTCMFAHPKPGKFTFILAVSTARGKIAMTTAVVTLSRIEDTEDETPVVRALSAPAPVRDTMKALTATARKANLESRGKVVTGLRFIAAQLLAGTITGDEELSRAVVTHLDSLGYGELTLAAMDAADAASGLPDDSKDFVTLGAAVNRIATIIESTK